ncbi:MULTISPECIES: aldo/keto reductase [Microbacterium]|uniref:aldo/keto reductase n=1 Tax=Microbacterium TaxID=33882 RepID=UPI0027805FD4|nr:MULTISPECIES: aldo/keto reductase [Microbacterium]MDQ1085150.1 aryl-alcohol dehydrogenase-like predicted oxidoreductase [Microbacterium sp. SORGH_AS_0344]MDQ1169544.1 aryl-alcohol dehydrogenase-like predicted oxidoreductase [Microbacterium proteolyticum]
MPSENALLPHRRVGGVLVSGLGLGCMPLTMSYGRGRPGRAGHLIARALDLGVTHFDTADMYGSGANERVLGAAIRHRRDEAFLATKVGIRSRAGIPIGVDGRPEHIRRAIDNSLRRLQTDHLDLYYLHRPDPSVPVEDSIGTLGELVAAGKVRQIGVSEFTGEQLRKAHAAHPISALQTEWSIFSRGIEQDALPVARELDIAIVAYAPLGRGMLTGSPQATTKLPLLDIRRTLPRWRRANLRANLRVVDQVRSVANQLDASPGQVALAWLLAQGPDVIPIPGTTNPAHLEDNVSALHVQLPAATLQMLSGLNAHGTRYV